MHIKQEIQVETAFPSPDDYLDLDLNNNKQVDEMPQNVKSVQKENMEIIIRKKQVENPQPLNMKIHKNEVYSDIPVLDQGQVLPRGKKVKV